MHARLAAIIAIALACSACANEKATDQLGYGMGAMRLAGATAIAPEQAPALPQKTLASKVLSAIALEQVTGRKPDPSRFSD